MLFIIIYFLQYIQPKMSTKYSQLSSSRASSSKSKSKVLLVCVYDTIIIQLTNDMVYNTFIPYGNVEKILIFERGEVTKCFVQFSKSQESENVRKELDGKKINNTFCKMHIFQSNLPEIDLKNKNNTRGKQYSSNSSQMNFYNTQLTPQKLSQTYDDFGIDSTKIQTVCEFQFSKSKTAGDQLSLLINKISISQPQFEEQSKLDDKIRWDIENILQQNEQKFMQNFQRRHNSKMQQNVLSKLMSSSQNQQMSDKIKPSQILSFRYQNKISVMEIYNLFSNFSNIEKIVIKNFIAFIQFTTLEDALLAKEYLNNTVLYGNLIRMNFSNQTQMQPRPKQYSQSIVFDQSFYRLNIKSCINPPSQTLHISNLKKQMINQSKLKDLFYDIAKVEKISFIPASGTKQKSMALVKFSSLEESFKVIATMHNKLVAGRKIQISFTKSKIT